MNIRSFTDGKTLLKNPSYNLSYRAYFLADQKSNMYQFHKIVKTIVAIYIKIRQQKRENI